jgi:hypothetical protein
LYIPKQYLQIPGVPEFDPLPGVDLFLEITVRVVIRSVFIPGTSRYL